MKFTAVATIAMAAMTSAEGSDILPSCAKPCLDKCVKSSTDCALDDYACICKKENFSKIQASATSCVVEHCGVEKAMNEVLPASQKLCEEAGKDETSAPASTEKAYETESSQPTETAQPTETQPVESEPADTECPTTMDTQPSPSSNDTLPPATSAPVTAGAAGLAPIGGLAILAIGALAL